MDFNELHYHSKVRLLISLKALETGTYQYHTDNWGSRVYDDNLPWWWIGEEYRSRESILEFIRAEQNSLQLNSGNEVMLKERVAPSFFTGLVVANEQTKRSLIDYLASVGLISEGRILNVDVERFIQVGSHASEELFQENLLGSKNGSL